MLSWYFMVFMTYMVMKIDRAILKFYFFGYFPLLFKKKCLYVQMKLMGNLIFEWKTIVNSRFWTFLRSLLYEWYSSAPFVKLSRALVCFYLSPMSKKSLSQRPIQRLKYIYKNLKEAHIKMCDVVHRRIWNGTKAWNPWSMTTKLLNLSQP